MYLLAWAYAAADGSNQLFRFEMQQIDHGFRPNGHCNAQGHGQTHGSYSTQTCITD
jgi:hypothetical protein